MNRKTKMIVAGVVASAAIASTTYEFLRRKGKQLYQRAFTTKKKEVDTSCWLYQQPYEIHHIQSEEGLNLQGYFLPKEDADFITVIIHGYHANAWRMSDYAEAFYQDFNCHVFLPDLRGHGESEGDMVGYGWLDKNDIALWINHLTHQYPDLPIAIFGMSMGGGTVCYLSDMDLPNVRCLIEDCGYSSLYDELDFQCREEANIPLWPVFHGLNQEVKKKGGYDIRDADGLNAVMNAKYPMMFIHGLDDETVPSQMVFDLYNACTSEKQLFFVKDTKHCDALKNSREAYLATLHEFINTHLYGIALCDEIN